MLSYAAKATALGPWPTRCRRSIDLTMASYRITFVHAPARQHDQYDNALFSPLWAYTLASHVPAGWDATAVDCLTDDKAAIGPAGVVAFSGTNQDLDPFPAVHGWLHTKDP